MKSSSYKNTDQELSKESNSNELVERIPITDTPFTAIRLDNKWFLTMGKYRISEPVDSFEQIQMEAENTTWDRIMQVILIVINEQKEADSRKSEALEFLNSTDVTQQKYEGTKTKTHIEG